MASTGLKADAKAEDKTSNKDAKADADDDDNEVVAEDIPQDDGTRAQAMKLHRYLGKVETLSIKQDYQDKLRTWKFTIGHISFTNQNDTKLSVFLAFALTDNRPASGISRKLNAIFGGTEAALSETKTIYKYTAAIRDVQPQQQVYFPTALVFREWFKRSTITMTYKDILKRGLRVEVWDRRDYGANVLLGSTSMTLSSIVHKSPDHEIYISRNVAPTTKGRSMNVGSVGFTSVLEEARLQHRLQLKHWSVCLSNHLGHRNFRHQCALHCSWPCVCAAFTCCCSGAEDTLQLWGFGEEVQVSVSLKGGNVVVKDAVTRRSGITLRAPMHSTGMGSAATTPDHPMTAAAHIKDGREGPKLVPASLPVNDSVSYSLLNEVGQDEALTINCSRSVLEQKVLEVRVRLKCRRCFSEGSGVATVSLSGVTATSFLPISAPIVFSRLTDGCCASFVTGGILRGYVLWHIDGAPLMHHFTQPPGAMNLHQDESDGVLALNKAAPALVIEVKDVGELPPVHTDGSVNPRITISWAGSTQRTRSVIKASTVEYHETLLKFPLPKLAGRDDVATLLDARDLLLPLQSHRYALVRVWDDPSYADLDNVGGVTYLTKRTELIGEAVMEIPFEKILGADSQPAAVGTEGFSCTSCCHTTQQLLLSGFRSVKTIEPVEQIIALTIPGADPVIKPTVTVQISFENLPLQNRLLCAPPLSLQEAPAALNLLPDFAAQVHVDAGTGLRPETAIRHVSAPGDRLQNADNTGRPVPKCALSVMKTTAGDIDPEMELDESEQVTNLPKLPSALAPIADFSHLSWWSVLLKMVELSNHANGLPWWLHTVPKGRKRLLDRAMSPASDSGTAPPNWNMKTPLELLDHVSPLLYAVDEGGIRRALPSLLAPLPLDRLLDDMERQLYEIAGAAFGAEDDATEQADEAVADEKKSSDSTPMHSDEKGSDKFSHLAIRACHLAASFEFTDSAEDVARLRQARGLVLASGARPDSESAALQLDARADSDEESNSIADGKSMTPVADPTRYFARIVLNSIQNGSWMSPAAFLSLRRGGVAEHAAFLCSALIGIGVDAYLAIGTISCPNAEALESAKAFFDTSIVELEAEAEAEAAGTPLTAATRAALQQRRAHLSRRDGGDAQTASDAAQKHLSPFAFKPKNLKVSTEKSRYDPEAHANATKLVSPRETAATPKDEFKLNIGPAAAGNKQSKRFGVQNMDPVDARLPAAVDVHSNEPHELANAAGAVPAPQVPPENVGIHKNASKRAGARTPNSTGSAPSRRDAINLLVAQRDNVVRLLAESVHYFVVTFNPPRIPGKVDSIEPDSVTVYDLDGACTLVKLKNNGALGDLLEEEGIRVSTSSTGVQYRRVLLLANHRNIWVNNQPATDIPKKIFGGSAVDAASSKFQSEVLSRPCTISETQFNLQLPNMWLSLFPEVASTAGAKGGMVASAGGASGDTFVQSQQSRMVQESAIFQHIGAGLGQKFLTYDSDSGGSRFFPSLGLDGGVTAAPSAMIPLVKRDLTDMELHKLMNDIAIDLNEAIINKRTFRKLSIGVVSSKPGYGPVMTQLRALLIAHACLELYAKGSDEYAAAARHFQERGRALKALVPQDTDQLLSTSYSVTSVAEGRRAENDETDDEGDDRTITHFIAAGEQPGKAMVAGSIDGDANTVISASRGLGEQRKAPARRAYGLDSVIRVFRINGANPARIRRVVLKDDTYFMKPTAEVALSVIVQQIISGIFVTRVAIMSVFPASG